MTDDNIVYFYDKESEFVKKEHICLNNFEPSPFKDENGLEYMGVEHYYQCHKFDTFELGEEFKTAFEEIRRAEDSDKCKKLARKYANEILVDKWNKKRWEEEHYKDYIMKKGLTFKFSQHKDMLKVLISTGDKKLVERSEKDPYWGGLLPNSLNKLGNMLMEIRENYKKTKTIFIEGSKLEPIKVEL